jgi:DNA polymerase-1
VIIHAPAEDIRICSIETDAELLQLGEWLGRHRDEVLGIDCETNARDPFDPMFQLRMVQISDGSVDFNIDVSKIDLRYLAHLIRRHRMFVAHYSENEVRFLSRGLPGSVRVDEDHPHIVDSQVTLAWANPRTVTSQDDAYGKIPQEKGLKPSSRRELGTDVLERAETERDAAASAMAPTGCRKKADQLGHWFATIPFDDLTYQVYSGLDAVMVKRLWDTNVAQIQQRGQWPGCQLDLSLQWHIDRATLRGLMIDGPYANWLDLQLAQVIAERAPKMQQHRVAISGMGPSVGEAFERMHITSPKMTRGKDPQPSWDRFVLAELAKLDGEVGVLARTITEVRKARKFRSTYIEPMLHALTLDGWMRCSMRAVGTITSRQSAMRPPVQQLPKRDTRVRAAICAPPGWVLVSCDFSQGEPRTMAGLSGDRNLLADILSGDLNSAIATAVFGSLYDPTLGHDAGTVHYLMRQGGKRAFLAWCYGAAPKKVLESLTQDFDWDAWAYLTASGVDLGSGDTIVRRWMARYPDLTRYRNDMNAGRHVVLENGWVAPLWDRAYLRDDGRITWGGRPSRKGLNYATQGNQRQLLAGAVHEVVRRGWGWALSMLVHDEILLCVPEWMAPRALADLQASMTMTFHGVPIEAEAKICGRTWTKQPDEFDMRELEFVEV